MKRTELFARLLVILVCLGIIAVPLGIYFYQGPSVLHARMAESGGWTPQVIKATVGKPLHLKLTSDDVMHGFAVGQVDMTPMDVEPGRISEVSLIFEKPGTYTFYCTRWCGLNHWRMRGTIEVGGGEPPSAPAVQPLYVALGINIDADHPAENIPGEKPAPSNKPIPDEEGLERILSEEYYRSHSPSQAFADLKDLDLTETQKWELVALAWRSNTSEQDLEEGRRLFAQNCAACHGELGGGNGIFADQLAAAGLDSMQAMEGAENMSMQRPADLSDPRRILGASPALLQGKLLRGGMGTGMPMWGSIFTDEQTWNLIAYIYSFHFRY